jgi:hypothetical protein
MSDTTRRRLLERDQNGKPAFRYVPAGQTDIAATFARVRKQQAAEAAPPARNVAPLRRVKK